MSGIRKSLVAAAFAACLVSPPPKAPLASQVLDYIIKRNDEKISPKIDGTEKDRLVDEEPAKRGLDDFSDIIGQKEKDGDMTSGIETLRIELEIPRFINVPYITTPKRWDEMTLRRA